MTINPSAAKLLIIYTEIEYFVTLLMVRSLGIIFNEVIRPAAALTWQLVVLSSILYAPLKVLITILSEGFVDL